MLCSGPSLYLAATGWTWNALEGARGKRLVHWTPDFDIATIPDKVLLRESVRRIRARQVRAPRLKVLRQRPKCRDAFGARELREHLRHCALLPRRFQIQLEGYAKSPVAKNRKRRITAIGRAFPLETGSPPSAK